MIVVGSRGAWASTRGRLLHAFARSWLVDGDGRAGLWMRLNPRHPFAPISHTGIAHAHIVRGDYPGALESADRARALNTTFDATLWMLIAANAHLGRLHEARHFLAALLELSPGVTIAGIRAGRPAKDPGRIEPILQGCGWPGCPRSSAQLTGPRALSSEEWLTGRASRKLGPASRYTPP